MLYLPQRAENRFFEVPTRASEVSGAFPADRNKLTGDGPRQFGNLENAVGYVAVDHGGLRVNNTVNGPIVLVGQLVASSCSRQRITRYFFIREAMGC